MRRVKEYAFIEGYWTSRDLVAVIHAYDENRAHRKDELSLGNLLA